MNTNTKSSDNKSGGGSRALFIDALKALASQLIVVHHLAFYGPMSDYALPLAPKLIPWLYDNARIAVQVFLVIGGFLAAKTLAREGVLGDKPALRMLWRRYLKLVPPYLGALLIAIIVAAVAGRLMDHESIPDAPTLSGFAAHVLLLHGVLGFDGLSAGVWYVAIDFQLFALLLLTLWVARRIAPQSSAVARTLVIVMVIASLFWFNRDDDLDNWAIYFFGAYGLGALVSWGVERRNVALWLAPVAIFAVLALVVDFRIRIAVALCVAIALGVARFAGQMDTWPKSNLLAWLGKISYSVFLVHFPVCLLTNAVFERYVDHGAPVQLLGMVIAWGASIAAGALFHAQVESRAQRWFSRPVLAAPPRAQGT